MEILEDIPAWITALIHAEFSKSANKNKDDHLKYCYVDCGSKAFTEKERQKDHHDHHVHHVLEAFSVSRHYGYEIGAIKRLKDKKGYDLFTGVASYKSNAILVYIQKSRARPYPYGQYKDKCKGDGNACVTCGWLLKDKPCRYCSILCKLLHEAKAKKESNSNVAVDQNSDEKLERLNYLLRNRPRLQGFRIRARKGIPYRAPIH